MTQASLSFLLDHKTITCVIPGFKSQKQVEENLLATQVPSFTKVELNQLEKFYQSDVHAFIRGPY